MATTEFVFLEGGVAIALIVLGTAWCVRFLGAAESVFGVRSSALALIIPIFGPSGFAVLEALQPHHAIRAISAGFSLASAAALLAVGAWSVWLGIRSINARIFQYVLLSIPIPIASVLALADSKITRFEGVSLILVYVAFVASSWWFDRLNPPQRAHGNALPHRLDGPALLALLTSCAITAAGSAILIACAHTAISEWHQRQFASSFAGLGTVAQISTFVWLSIRRERSDLALAGVVGTLAFNSTVTIGIFGLTSHRNWIDPSIYTIAAVAALVVPVVLFLLAFKQTKRWFSGAHAGIPTPIWTTSLPGAI